jgi:hypothetical protein
MQKIYYTLLLLVFLSVASCLAKITTAIGATQSTLRYNDGKRALGQYVGIGFEANPYSFLLGFETAFVAKNVLPTNLSYSKKYHRGNVKNIMKKGGGECNGEHCFRGRWWQER